MPPTTIPPNCLCPFEESAPKGIFDGPSIIPSFQPYQDYPAPIEYGRESVLPEYATPLTTEVNNLQFNTKHTYGNLLCQILNVPSSYPTIPDYSYKPGYEYYSEPHFFMPEHISNTDFILDIGIQQQQTIEDEDIKDIHQSFSKARDEESAHCIKIQQQINEAAKKNIKISEHLSNDMNKCLNNIMTASLEVTTDVNNLVKDTGSRLDEDNLHSNTGVLNEENTLVNPQVKEIVKDVNSSVKGQAVTNIAGISKETDVNNREIDLVEDDSTAKDTKTENTSIKQEEINEVNNGGANSSDDSRVEDITENTAVSHRDTNAGNNGGVELLEHDTMAQDIITEDNGISQKETNSVNNGGGYLIEDDLMAQNTVTKNTSISQDEVINGGDNLVDDSKAEGITDNIAVSQEDTKASNNGGVKLLEDDTMAQRMITENNGISREETNSVNDEGVDLIEDDSMAQHTINENTGISQEKTDAVNKGGISLLEDNFRTEGTVTENLAVAQEKINSGNNEGVNFVEDDSMAQPIITENSSNLQEKTNAKNNERLHLVDDSMAQHTISENTGNLQEETDDVKKGGMSLLEDNLRAEGNVTENIENNGGVNLVEDDSMTQGIENNGNILQKETNAMNNGGVQLVDDSITQHTSTENTGFSQEKTDAVEIGEISLVEGDSRLEDIQSGNAGVSKEEIDDVNNGRITVVEDDSKTEGTNNESTDFLKEKNDAEKSGGLDLLEDDLRAENLETKKTDISQDETNAVNNRGINSVENVDSTVKDNINSANVGVLKDEGPFILSKENNYGMDSILRSMTFMKPAEDKTDKESILQEFKERDEISSEVKEKDNTEITGKERGMPLHLLTKENNYGLHSNQLRSDSEQISTTNLPPTTEQTKHSKPKIIDLELLPNLTNKDDIKDDLDDFTKPPLINFRTLDVPTLLDSNFTTEILPKVIAHGEDMQESKTKILDFPDEKISGSNMNDNKHFMDSAMRTFSSEISSELTEHEDDNPGSNERTSLPTSDFTLGIQDKVIKQEESKEDNTPGFTYISDRLKESNLETIGVTRVIEVAKAHKDNSYMSIKVLHKKYGINNPFRLNPDEMKAVPPILPGTKQGFVNIKTENFAVPIRITNNNGYVNIGVRMKDICPQKDGRIMLHDSMLIEKICSIIGLI